MTRIDQIAPHLDDEARRAMALAELEAFDLDRLAGQRVTELSVGRHKLIDLARAAAGEPPLVLLDEPAVGLAEEELAHLEELLRRLRARNSAIVIVEHNIGFVERVAERGIVLDSGRPIAVGPIGEILADERVREAYFGALS